jgi:hypothetical protein
MPKHLHMPICLSLPYTSQTFLYADRPSGSRRDHSLRDGPFVTYAQRVFSKSACLCMGSTNNVRTQLLGEGLRQDVKYGRISFTRARVLRLTGNCELVR